MCQLGGPIPARVVIVRALPGLGDLLCIVPALRALRVALPGAEVCLLGLPWARGFAQRFGRYLDGFLEFPGYPGIPERSFEVRRLPAFLAKALGRRFDLAIQMHGSGQSSNAFTMLLGARYTAGFYLPGNYCPDERLFLPFDEREAEVRRYLRLMELLGFPSRGEELEFPLADADFEALEAIPAARELRAGQYVCIHPGAKDAARRWPPERFAMLADSLARQGLRVAITGTAGEHDLAEAVARSMSEKATNLAGCTGLGALGALLAGARLLVCNDTGVSHLAAALRTPSVVIFTGSDPERWAPLDRQRHRVARSDLSSMDGPPVEEVLEQAEDLLRKENVHAA